MKHYLFECAHHADLWFDGWKQLSKSFVDPVPGMGVAHDILEHSPTEKGSVEEEIIALGCSIYVRDFGSYYSLKGNVNPIEKHIASDFIEFVRHLADRGDFVLRKICPAVSIHEDIADIVDRCLDEIANLLNREANHDDYFAPEIRKFLTDDNLSTVKNLLAFGYRKALRRYSKVIDSYDLAAVFASIESQADRLLKKTELGERMRVSIDLKTHYAHCQKEG